MKQKDILNEVHSGKMSEVEADEFFDSIIDSNLSYDARRILNLSTQEWGAKIQGTTWGGLARWRYSGWPRFCVRCGKEINHEKFGWWVVSDEGVEKLRHIRCLQ